MHDSDNVQLADIEPDADIVEEVEYLDSLVEECKVK